MSKVVPLCYTKSCEDCIIGASCPALHKTGGDKNTGLRTRIYRKGELAFSEGDRFKGLFILRSGSALSTIISEDGHQQVTHFYYGKDMFGFDGFDRGYHSCRLKFLETSNVCQLEPFFLENQLSDYKEVRKKLLQAMSHSFVEGNRKRLEHNNMNAEQRLCQFIVDLSLQHKKLNRNYNPLVLSMTRRDLGNYLGMAIETVSRVLNTLVANQLISVSHRYIKIHDYQSLYAICQSKTPNSFIFSEPANKSNQIPINF